MRNRFDSQLEALNRGIIEMGALVEDSLKASIDALLAFDRETAKKIVVGDKEIDQKMKEIETLCLRLLLSQQPVARDLRLISASLKMVGDLERIGDQAADIAEIVAGCTDQDGTPLKLAAIPPMGIDVLKMLAQSIDAFVRKDLKLAKIVIESDDDVDFLFRSAKRELVETIRKTESDAESIIHSIMIAKYLERIGDHAMNVAQWAIFAETGTHHGANLLNGADDFDEK
ncbi:phosphate transport system regulatory protein PhoU [Fibrobacter succinogenes subsp. succinogenes S85]|uniref:Phosphate-specific transport system accessory protein PhoU n=1 Tax=Fibrobacter succinogenes (strain ATCC 19169 / S85) TaxID=59374 RepID=C9RRV9_FIBSS|nr:phosphate signaling complex protein PhoU [Fibrobacter succinogenes]ACX75295.1 phosphate uptake regulator, PhoU [Fibrobacter succinogenes subsp. succinogenes S85]ADL27238.1 phosphate transport system regulatory protein PhoU [Fibrobacter succinogenes subsp. succinogenes S85]